MSFADLVGGVLGAGLVQVEDGDVPSGGGEGVGGGAADATLGAGPGDEGGLVGHGHGSPPRAGVRVMWAFGCQDAGPEVDRRGRRGAVRSHTGRPGRCVGRAAHTVAGAGSATHWGSSCRPPPSSALTLVTMASVDRP